MRGIWRDLACLAVLAGVTLRFFWPALAQGQMAYENDTRIFYYPLFVQLGQAIKRGLFPLWSAGVFTGYPIFADGEAGALYPLNLLALLALPVDVAFLWLRPIRFFQAGAFTYLFCRTLGLGRVASLAGGLAFEFSGFAVAQMHHTNISTDAVWLPLALAFGELAIRRGGRPRYAFALLAGVAFGMQGLIIHLQVVLMSVMAFAAFCAFRCANGPVGANPGGPWQRLDAIKLPGLPGTGPSRAASAVLGRLGLAVSVVAIAGATGMGLAAVQLLPLWELSTFSLRGGGVDYAFATQYSLPPIQLISLLLPDFFVRNGQYWGLWSRWEVFIYCGIAPLVLALLAIPLARRRLTWFFLGLGLISLALAFGEYSPLGIHRTLSDVPGFSVLRAPGRFAFLFSFSVAILASFAADALRRQFAQPRQADGRTRGALLDACLLMLQLACMVAPLLVAAAGVFAQGNKDVAIQWLQDTFLRARGFDGRWSVEHLYLLVLASLDVASSATMRQLALLLGTVAVLLAWDRLRALSRLWQALLVALIAVDLVVWGQSFHPMMPLESLAEPSGAATYLSQQAGAFRVFTQKGSRDEPNRLLSYDIAEANGYGSLEPVRHQQYSVMAEYAPNRLLDLLNARYYAVKNRFEGLPSFNLTSFNPSRPLLSSTSKNPAGSNTFLLEDAPADTIRIVSTLRWSTGVPQGTEVARLTALDSEGRQYTFRVVAGVHTAEWSYERPDIRPKMAHQLPPPSQLARTWQQVQGNAPPFPAHLYYAEFPLGRSAKLRRVDVQFTHPGAQVDVYGIAAFDDTTKDLEQLDLAKLAKLRRVYGDQDVLLYENQSYLPRAFLVPSAIVERPGDEILTRMAIGDFDPERVVILEDQFDTSRLSSPSAAASLSGVRFDKPGGTEISSGAGTVSLLQLDADRLRLSASAVQNAMLLLTDLMYPGWTANIDGTETPIYRADYIFRAVYLPAGQHSVEFRYQPTSFRLGLLVSVITIAGTLLALAALARSWNVAALGRRLVGRQPRPRARQYPEHGAGNGRAASWPLPGAIATMGSPDGAPPAAAAANIDRGISAGKGATRYGRQEPKEHRQEEHPKEGGRGGKEEVAPASSPLSEAAPGHSGS